MKKHCLLALLLSGSLTAWAQSQEPVTFFCPQPPRNNPAGGKATAGALPTLPSNPLVWNRPNPGPGPGSLSCPGVLNVNVHFMLRLDGTGNFNETDDGTPYKPWYANQPTDPTLPADTARNGYARAKELVTEMNNQAATNPLNGNPAGTSNPPKGFMYALNGVYFHRVGPSEFNIVKQRYQGIFTDSLFNNYGVNKASEINMFITGDYQDTTRSAFDLGGVACTIGFNPAAPDKYWLKVFNSHLMYEWRKVNEGKYFAFLGHNVVQDSYRPTANTFGHEVGHIIGLDHTFGGANGCADAAVQNPGNGWNNQMDYTGASGTALTPCQLGVVNYKFYNPGNPANSFRN